MGSRAWGSGNATYCETFTEDVTGCGWQGVSAIAAWENNPTQQHIGETALVGDALYFGPHPENLAFGHTGIVTGPDEFTSVTFGGVQRFPISSWKAPLLGFIRYYA